MPGMALYDYHIVRFTVPNGAVRTKVLSGNSRRVSIVLSSFVGIICTLANAGGSGTEGVFGFFNPTLSDILAFRDYGPIIQGEIWLSHNSGVPVQLAVTEVYLLSQC